jgi:hypothetical protein
LVRQEQLLSEQAKHLEAVGELSVLLSDLAVAEVEDCFRSVLAQQLSRLAAAAAQ